MYQFLVATSVMPPPKRPEEPLHDAIERVVHQRQVDPEEHRRQNHDHRRGVDLFLRRPGHALQLVAHLAEKQPRPLEPAARRFLARSRLWSFQPSFLNF